MNCHEMLLYNSQKGNIKGLMMIIFVRNVELSCISVLYYWPLDLWSFFTEQKQKSHIWFLSVTELSVVFLPGASKMLSLWTVSCIPVEKPLKQLQVMTVMRRTTEKVQIISRSRKIRGNGMAVAFQAKRAPMVLASNITLHTSLCSGVRIMLESIQPVPLTSCLTLKQNDSSFLGLGFLIYKMGIAMESVIQDCSEDKGAARSKTPGP